MFNPYKRLIAANYDEINTYCDALMQDCVNDKTIYSALTTVFNSDLIKYINKCILKFSIKNGAVTHTTNDVDYLSGYMYKHKLETVYMVSDDYDKASGVMKSKFHYHLPTIAENIQQIAYSYGYKNEVPYALVLLYTYILVNTNYANFNNINMHRNTARLINAMILNMSARIFKNKLVQLYTHTPNSVILKGNTKSYIDHGVNEFLRKQTKAILLRLGLAVYGTMVISYLLWLIPYTTIMDYLVSVYSRWF